MLASCPTSGDFISLIWNLACFALCATASQNTLAGSPSFSETHHSILDSTSRNAVPLKQISSTHANTMHQDGEQPNVSFPPDAFPIPNPSLTAGPSIFSSLRQRQKEKYSLFEEEEESLSKLKTLENQLRHKRQVDFDPVIGESPGPSVRALNHDDDTFEAGPKCPPALPKHLITPNPLKCYQCESYSTDNEPRCGDATWKYLAMADRYQLSIRCPENRGHYCAKKVGVSASGQIWTVRGCMGPGPVHSAQGAQIKLKEGCLHHMDKNFTYTTCFCKSDLCNSVQSINSLSLANIFLNVFVFKLNVMFSYYSWNR